MQIKLGSIGEKVEGIEDLKQEIYLILSTPLGSIPHMPEFGSKIYEYIDRPMTIAKALIIGEAYRAIKRNCTRFKVSSIKLSTISPGKYVFKISGLPQDSRIDSEVVLDILTDFTH